MKTELRPGEAIVKAGAANLRRNVEMVGGRLYLTSQRLVFESHRINVQTGITALERMSIRSVRPDWTRLFGLVPLLPNALVVTTFRDEEYLFSVFGRQAWTAAIRGQLVKNQA